MHRAVFTRLCLRLSFERHCIDEQLRYLIAGEFPSDAARNLIDVLSRECRAQESRVAALQADFETDPAAAFDLLKTERWKVLMIQSLLDTLERAQTRRVPWSLIPTIDRLFADLHPNREVVAYCSCGDGYSIRWYPKRPAYLQPFLFLELSGTNRLNPFHHILVAHEVFHPLIDEFLDSCQVRALKSIHGKVSKLEEALAPSKDLFAPAERLDRMIETTRYIWRRGMEELACDLGCVRILGPAALFATMSYSAASDLDELPTLDNDYYPPWRKRLREMLRRLDEGQCKKGLQELREALDSKGPLSSYGKRLDEELELVATTVLDDTDNQRIKRYPLCRIAYEEIDNFLGEAWSHVCTLAKPSSVEWLATVGEVPQHLRSLLLMVPPGEVIASPASKRQPASIAAILQAAWLFELERQHKEKGELLSGFQRSCRLLFKGMEDSELRRTIDSQEAKA